MGAWSASGNLLTARSGRTSTLLSSGEVLVVSDSSAEVFNPYGNTSRATDAPLSSRLQRIERMGGL